MYWASVVTLIPYFLADSMHLFYTAPAPPAGRGKRCLVIVRACG
jgi:hypothetical protein